MFIPTLLLKKLYTLGSLTNVERGVRFGIKNRLSNAEIIGRARRGDRRRSRSAWRTWPCTSRTAASPPPRG